VCSLAEAVSRLHLQEQAKRQKRRQLINGP
jgi:hypothetical protein